MQSWRHPSTGAWIKFILKHTETHTFCHIGGNEGRIVGTIAAENGLSVRTKSISSMEGCKPSWMLCDQLGSVCPLHGCPSRFMKEKGLSPMMHCPLAEITAIHSNDLNSFRTTRHTVCAKVLGLVREVVRDEGGPALQTATRERTLGNLYFPERFEWLEHTWKPVEVPQDLLNKAPSRKGITHKNETE